MKVLGISPLDKDVTVSFVEDGRVLFACGEERLSRVKLQDGFPSRALELGFERTGWSPDEIDQVAYAFLDADGEERAIRQAYDSDAQSLSRDRLTQSAAALRRALAESATAAEQHGEAIPGLDAADEYVPPKAWWKRAVYRWSSLSPTGDAWMHGKIFRQWIRDAVADHQLRTRQLTEGMARYGLRNLKRYNHHRTHAANAFYSSGFSKALAVSLDGYGTGNCGAVYLCDPNGLKLLHQFKFPSSLGIYYEYVTSALGFRAGRHEGKIVGLAAYGDPEVLAPALRARFTGLDQGEITMHGAMNYYFSRMLAQNFSKRDIAAAYQTVLEEVVQRAVTHWVRQTDATRIVVSGGVNANVKLNQRLHEIDTVKSVFVYPNMGDGGCATGAALLAFEPDVLARAEVDNVYYGPDYTSEEIEAALRKAEVEFEYGEDVEERVGKLLADDCIIARFNGRMEYGPRALGNRSILYQARDPQVNLWLNHQLGRTEFMPFAPACLAEHADDLFKNVAGCEKTAEFMTITFDCTEQMKSQCPAAVHVDGTARPQLVSEQTNASFYRIIRSYFAETGIPAIINTSFNMHEEPIVCSPDDAVRAFLKGRMDYLAIGNYLVPHPNLPEISRQRSALTCR